MNDINEKPPFEESQESADFMESVSNPQGYNKNIWIYIKWK